MKKTKVVATIGPASESRAMMEKMLLSGLNVARLNFSHGDYRHHEKFIKNLRGAAKKTKKPLAIIQDLQGPRIRIGEVGSGVRVAKNEEVTLATEVLAKKNQDQKIIPVQYPALSREVKAGHAILIDDAAIELKVSRVQAGKVFCRVVTGGLIKTHKGLNFPDSRLACPPITKKDWADLEFGIIHDVDFVAMSFVKEAGEVLALRRKILFWEKKYGKNQSPNGLAPAKTRGRLGQVTTRIIAKIERREAVDNFDAILEAADGIMVARGDLGIELPFEDLPLIQKNIIEKCRQAGKPVIVATQMLDSMIRNPLPTRAEVSDVANAILDGADAVMLSGETASGRYPLKAIQAMSRIAKEVEARVIAEQEAKEGGFKNFTSVNQVMGFIAQDLAEDVSGARLIVCATVSGFTAKNIARFRPGLPVVAVSPAQKIVNQLSLSWGVEPYFGGFTASFNTLLPKVKKIIRRERLARRGSIFILVAGHPFGYKGQTNLIKVENV